MSEKSGREIPIQIIDKFDKDLYFSKITDLAIKVAELDGNVINKDSKQDRLQALIGEELYGGSKEDKPDLSLFGKIFNNPDENDKQRRIEKYKQELLYPTFLVDKNNIPDSYFKLRKKIARNRNETNLLDTSEEAKKITSEIIYKDQKQSLDRWIDYIASPDALYPIWFKYYTLRSVVNMGSYDKGKHEFSKRTKTNTNMFPDLNQEALTFTYDVLQKHYIQNEPLEGEELNKVLDSANFSKIYAFAMEKVTPASKENKEKTEGVWTRFKQGSGDATALYESLQGHGTGWCTAGEGVSESQLKKGDFYVYYTKDENNYNTIPRIAIRMENDQVAEVRGVGHNQNMEDNMIYIAQEKYHQLPSGEKFDKKNHDMKLLTLIDKKVNDHQELTKEDLRFLYEVDSKIEGFGYNKDPRIKEIVNKRNIKSDLSSVLDCKPEQISTTEEEALKGDIKFHYGNLDLSHITSAEGLTLPETINGYLDLSHITSAEGLILPETINGSLYLDNLTSIEGLIFPKSIYGYLYLHNITSIKGSIFPTTISYGIYLNNLIYSEKELLRKKYPKLNIFYE